MEGNKQKYEALYDGAYRGDSWTLPENFDENPRARAVLEIREKFAGPVSVLDIGCGKGGNTKWIAEKNDGSSWTGVDVVPKEKMGLDIPHDTRYSFFEGEILDKRFRETVGLEHLKFDIIVDQGAAFVEIDDLNKMEDYLKIVHNLLSDKGVFLALTVLGEPQTIIFSDGRKRVIHTPGDFQKEPFSKYFDVDEEAKENPFSYAGHSYPASFKTALGSDVNLQIAQVPFNKRVTPQYGNQ